MPDFLPVNSLEIALRKLITGEDGRIWQFLVPLAAAPLWLITKHYPELDGSDLVAPPGQNPQPCVFQGPEGTVVSVYTAEERVRAAFEFFRLSRANFTWISLQGHPLLQWLYADCARHGEAEDVHFVVNFGAGDSYYDPKTEMIGYLLERPAPPPLSDVPDEFVDLRPAGNPEATLGPLRDFLARSPNVRAAWIFGAPPASPGAPAPATYTLSLVMVDPEDQTLLERVGVILKAVTPLETEWSAGTLMASDDAYRQMAAAHPPFYAAAGFLAT